MEAKKAGVKLSEKETNQLRSYFTFSEAAAAILTNGVNYWLFTDLIKTNVMDATPYHRADVKHLTDNDIHHLETLTRSQARQSAVHEQAKRERHRKMVKEIVDQELDSPSQEFLKLVGKKAGIKPLTQSNLKMLEPLVREAISRNRGVAPPPEPKPASSAIDSAGKKASQTLARFKGATLFGKDLSADNYSQMLISVAKEMQIRHPNDFDERILGDPFLKKTRKWQYISKDENVIHSPRKMGQFYIDVHGSRATKVKRTHLFLSSFGYKPDEVLIIHTLD